MQTDNPETPAGKLAEKQKPNPSKATPIGRDISDAKLRALKPAEKAYRQAVGGGLYLEVMPTGSKRNAPALPPIASRLLSLNC